MRDLAQHRLENIFLAGEFLHFAIGNLRRLEHGEGNNLGAIANQDRALFFVPFNRELDATLDVEPIDFLQRTAALLFLAGLRLLGARWKFSRPRLPRLVPSQPA